ncbi:MAG: signal recognition particle-docking protein FtsY [Pseudanabaenaceae cyanobacterium]
MFDWFRRRFTDADKPADPPVEPPTESPPAPDLLAWAKAAYAKTQAEAPPPPADSPAPDSPPPADPPTATAIPKAPAWLRNEGDRQARLTALAATAREEAIAEPKTGKGLVFNEEFLWTAEVLAGQGRAPESVSAEEIVWLQRLRQGLDKTRNPLLSRLQGLMGGTLSAEALEDLEALLLQADVGPEATDYILGRLADGGIPAAGALPALKGLLREILDGPTRAPLLVPVKNQLNIWLMVGVNGAGKTTTIGKLANLAQRSGYSTLIAAADTFRAAAVQQVKAWGERAGVTVIANTGTNVDPAAVVFDAIMAAQARGTELLLVDTAGRLQNKQNLMDELHKIRRIVDKKAPEAQVETLLVLDATLGQNGVRQAEAFTKAAAVSGVVLTKLDGTARGGVAVAVVRQLGLPIRFIGAGEGVQDLKPFSSYEFVEALLAG